MLSEVSMKINFSSQNSTNLEFSPAPERVKNTKLKQYIVFQIHDDILAMFANTKYTYRYFQITMSCLAKRGKNSMFEKLEDARKIHYS